MGYKVRIRDNTTGEIRVGNYDLDWHEASVFLWTEGNFGCDCNRATEFLRAGGPGPPNDPHWNDYNHECGDTAFGVLDATLEDGTVIELDSP